MMTLIKHIFEALGEATAISNATGDPVQTVHSWKVKGSIPPWRRADVLRVKPLPDKQLSPAALEYLTSRDRKPILSTERSDTAAEGMAA